MIIWCTITFELLIPSFEILWVCEAGAMFHDVSRCLIRKSLAAICGACRCSSPQAFSLEESAHHRSGSLGRHVVLWRRCKIARFARRWQRKKSCKRQVPVPECSNRNRPNCKQHGPGVQKEIKEMTNLNPVALGVRVGKSASSFMCLTVSHW